MKDTKTAQSPKVTAEGSGSKRDASTMWFVSQKQDAPKALFEEEVNKYKIAIILILLDSTSNGQDFFKQRAIRR